MEEDTITFLPAEWFGSAQQDENGFLSIGTGDHIVNIPLKKWWEDGCVDIYVRRLSTDLSIAEIHIVKHDFYAQEQLDAENEEAERYPLGPKEYWRSKMVGKYGYGIDAHPMTEEEFEREWAEDEECD